MRGRGKHYRVKVLWDDIWAPCTDEQYQFAKEQVLAGLRDPCDKSKQYRVVGFLLGWWSWQKARLLAVYDHRDEANPELR